MKPKFALYLKICMTVKGTTQEWLAAKTGVDRATISAWCSGLSTPDIVKYEKAIFALGGSWLGYHKFKSEEHENEG